MGKIRENGLSTQEAEAGLKKYGLNVLEAKNQISWFKLLFEQFKSPLIYILVLAGFITLAVGEFYDSLVIFLAVGVNTALGFYQEFKAEKALVLLQKILSPTVSVLRDGREQIIESKLLIPNDIVMLKNGNKVPADGLLIEAIDLTLDEALLTGESMPVNKKGRESVYMGTVVLSGRAKMLIYATGSNTKMGKIAVKLSETTAEETPLKKQIGILSNNLAILFTIICILLLVIGIVQHRPWLEMFILSVAVAVAAIPEGLVISLTVILTLGMQRILKRKGLVRKLLAAETLGVVDVICADKTGTLTEGKMKVVNWETGQDQGKLLIEAALLCNNLTNPLEISMKEWALRQTQGEPNKLKINDNTLLEQYQRIDEIPFSSQRKYIATLHKTNEVNQGLMFVSGAPEVMMVLANLSNQERIFWQQKLDSYSQKGLRVVAFCYAKDKLGQLKLSLTRLPKKLITVAGKEAKDNKLTNIKWLGLLIFEDPLRKEVNDSLLLCQKAGIEVKVITGDYHETAVALLSQLTAIGKLKEEQIMEGGTLEQISEPELTKKIDDIVLFCRTTPEQKIRIVKALKDKGHVVAMMGDGVNDALALKKADIGIVVAQASEVAKETADMVLLDSNFKTIEAAVEEGRLIFSNIKKVVLYLLLNSFTEMILIGGSLLLFLPTPLLPAQILWINLFQDSLPALALAFEVKIKGIMTEKPKNPKSPIIDKQMKILIFIGGIVNSMLWLSLFFLFNKWGWDLKLSQTIMFTAIGLNTLFYIFSCKNLTKNIWQISLLDNKWLLGAVLAGWLLMLSALFLPGLRLILRLVQLSLVQILFATALGFINVPLLELIKWIFIKKRTIYQKD